VQLARIDEPQWQRDRLAMILTVGTKVRFYETFRPVQVGRESVGVIIDMEERPTPLGTECWVRARFGDFISPWIEEWRLERASGA
jgi:hypothetical protein